MMDALFEYEENKLLKKRPTPIREHMLKKLEFRALLEEVAASIDIRNDELPMGSDAYRFVQGGQGSSTYKSTQVDSGGSHGE